ncbi:hypothetical protein [Nonomuraea bangladeshensis]|uniref:hypothetical protein n=1 Tax=Nonomuraea bangladeshensis TaxID=404385 RepID=UPI003C2F1596
MDKRRIKREACFRAAMALDTALAGGWDTLDELYGKDADKVRDAINEIVTELKRRAGEA